MTKFEVAKPVRLLSGKVKLTKEQAAIRNLHLKVLKETQKTVLAEITRPVQFKAGEILEFEGDVPKGILPDLIDLTPKPKAEKSTEDDGGSTTQDSGDSSTGTNTGANQTSGQE